MFSHICILPGLHKAILEFFLLVTILHTMYREGFMQNFSDSEKILQ